MIHLFYLSWVFILIYELAVLKNARKFHKFIVHVRTNYDSLDTEDSVHLILLRIFYTFYLALTIAGLLTSQWMLFALLLLMGFIPKLSAWCRKVDSLLSLGVIIFALLNAYHFNIDLWQLITNL